MTTIVANDVDGTQFFWQIVQAPAGLTLTPGSTQTSDDSGYHNQATLSWTPTAHDRADSEVIIRVQDSRGGVATRRLRIPVLGGNQVSQLGSLQDLELQEGQSLLLPLSAADADGDTLTLTVRNLPAGASFDASNGLLTWTPGYDQAGQYNNITVLASDGKSTVSQTFNITVMQGHAQPVLLPVAAQTLRESEAFALQLAGSMPGGLLQADGTVITLEYSAPWLPGDQQIKNGVITQSPTQSLFSMPTIHTNTAPVRGTYIIESPRRAADGTIIEEGRIVTLEAYAKACDGILEINQQGEVVYKVCFAAGTLIHTDKGLMPIEQVRVGTRVLAQPEELYEKAGGNPRPSVTDGSQRAWQPVVNTVAHLDQHVFAVQIKVQGKAADHHLTTLIATPGHPFWVQGQDGPGEGWLAVDQLQPGHVLQLADGSEATVHAAGLVRRTQHAHIGFAADDRANDGSGAGIVLDLSDGRIKQASEALTLTLGPLELGDAYLTTVHNFEVQEFHTYYVGDIGVWVHNDNCDAKEARSRAIENANLREKCFEDDTPVLVHGAGKSVNWIDIQNIAVGMKVLSRCEVTGEMGFKRVTKVFGHDFAQTMEIHCIYGPNVSRLFGDNVPVINATAEHPFWVQEKGWTTVRDLKSGDKFFTYDGEQAIVKEIRLNRYTAQVYNLEVEDFHTYFVGAGIWVHNKNPEIDVSRLDTSRFANTTPEWSPIYKSIEEMTDVFGNPFPSYVEAVRERKVIQPLNGAGIQMLLLPAQGDVFQNGAGNRITNNFGKTGGYPDGLLSSTAHPDLNGVVADIYQPIDATNEIQFGID